MNNNLKKLKGLNFKFTEKMEKTLFDMIMIQNILDSEGIGVEEREKLEEEKVRLLNIFKKDLHTNNPVEISIVRAILNKEDSKQNI